MISKGMFRALAGMAAAAALFLGGMAVGQNKFGTPSSVIHLVIVKWKTDSSEADRKKAIDGVKGMATAIPGIKNVWVKPLRVQPFGTLPQGEQAQQHHTVFAIEFENEAAAKRYVDHPAHKQWEQFYLSVREESRSEQVTN